MKKLLLLAAIGVLFANCQQEETTNETSANLIAKTTVTDQDAVPNKYFGVLSTFDTQIHGELRINLETDTEFQAIVTLVNGDVLKFEAIEDRTNPSIMHFKGSIGSFTMDFSDKNNIVTTNFLVDHKEGYIAAFPESGRGSFVIVGTYVDAADPSFNGNWDMINNGTIDPNTNLFVIDNITINRAGVTGFFDDETPGVFEPFLEDCVFPATTLMGGQFNGCDQLFGQNQIATFNGVETTWDLNVKDLVAWDPNSCSYAPAGSQHGTWTRGSRSGTLTWNIIPGFGC
jgi:hypothetical protein